MENLTRNRKKELIKKYGLRCMITDEYFDSEEELNVHQILPRSKGGTSDISNLLLVSKKINSLLSDKINPELIRISLPGMRDSGQIIDKGSYFVAEYEYRGLRLQSLAKEIFDNIKSPFILYDYKATISSNNKDALLYLNENYGDVIELESDTFSIDDNIITLTTQPLNTIIDYIKDILFPNHNKEIINVILNPNIEIKSKNEITPALGVEEIAKTLSSVITKQPDDSGMMIGIFGKWGRGKSYLAEKTWDDINHNKPKYKKIFFSAWKYQDTKASWVYLYETILSSYLSEKSYDSSRPVIKQIKKWCNYNYRLWKINVEKYKIISIFVFIGTLFSFSYWSFFVDKISFFNSLFGFFGFVTLVKLFLLYLQHKSGASLLFRKYFSKKSFSEHLGLQFEIECEINNLLKTWIPKAGNDEKVVLFVDDIDRCNIEQIINMIDGLRVILDNSEINKRLIIITAIDEKILKSALQYKYSTFTENEIDLMYTEYLEKIFIVGLKLNDLRDYEIREFLRKLIPRITSKENKNSLKEEKLNLSTSINEKNNLTKSTINDNTTENLTVNDEKDFELNVHEKEHLLSSIIKLNNATPRKIRIFYYKYLIAKKLFHIKLEEKNLLNTWNESCSEKLIIDTLISLSNNEELIFNDNKINKDIFESLKYTVEMVSVI